MGYRVLVSRLLLLIFQMTFSSWVLAAPSEDNTATLSSPSPSPSPSPPKRIPEKTPKSSVVTKVETGNVYRLKTTINVFSEMTTTATEDPIPVGNRSRFEVIGEYRFEETKKTYYEVVFKNIYEFPTWANERTVEIDCRKIDEYATGYYSQHVRDENCTEHDEDYLRLRKAGTTYNKSRVNKGASYYIPKENLASRVTPANRSLSSGPLIVPFKYRGSDGGSLGGEAMIGMYAGYDLEFDIGQKLLIVTPLLAAGLSVVETSKVEGTEINEDSDPTFSLATGLLLKNWDKANIGIVVGWDWTGDKEWEHEGDIWYSFSVGWKLEK